MEKGFSSGLSSALAGGADTVVARSSPAGRGGLAVIRVSGGGAREIAARVCPGLDADRGWRASLVAVRGADGEPIDRAVAVSYPAPRSYTGEDMVELTVHGSPWVVRATVGAFVAAGARPAEPGEFTRRAVANGKLDLVQAEAVNDLCSAETEWQARLARAQLEGGLSDRFADLRDALTGCLSAIEAALDFGHHDIDYDLEAVTLERDRARAVIDGLLETADSGRRIRDGLRVAITGPKNSGKSTLFNTLVGSERAIVSAHPGTTRDVVEAHLEIAGVPVVLQDTAGLGEAVDPVEREGVRRARLAVETADAVIELWPADGRCETPPIERPGVRVRSKWDLARATAVEDGWVAVSCASGEGLDRLRRELASVACDGVGGLGGEVAIAERHRRCLVAAAAELDAVDLGLPEVAAEAVRGALEAVRDLTGEVASEDVLDRIFGSFCIGK